MKEKSDFKKKKKVKKNARDLNPGPSVFIVIPLMPPPMQRLSKDSTKLFDGEVNVLNEKGFSASRGKTPKNQLF